jgi:hypothetical protein
VIITDEMKTGWKTFVPDSRKLIGSGQLILNLKIGCSGSWWLWSARSARSWFSTTSA